MNNLSKKYAGLVLLVVLAIISGCVSAGTSPQARFYSLGALEESEVAKMDVPALKGVIIGVGPLELPAYLRRPQIVSRGRDNELVLAEFNRWAEPLEDALPRVITQNLLSIFPHTQVLLYPWNYYVPVKYQVVAEIISIDAALQNEVRLSLNWSLVNTEDKKVFLNKNSVFHSKINKANYNSMVEAFNQGLYEFSLEVARAIAAEVIPSSEAGPAEGKSVN